MKIWDMTNLYAVRFYEEDFTVLVVAQDETEAGEVARTYAFDNNFFGNFDIFQLENEAQLVNLNIDADYILTYSEFE